MTTTEIQTKNATAEKTNVGKNGTGKMAREEMPAGKNGPQKKWKICPFPQMLVYQYNVN